MRKVEAEQEKADTAIRMPNTLPIGWEWKTMEDIADVVGGGTPRTADSSYYTNGLIPWITPADLSGYKSKYISFGGRNITQQGLENSSARMMPAGAVLFTSRAPIGYVAIAANPLCTNQGFKSFVLKEDVMSEYVYWWLKASKDLAESMASGTTFLELSGAKAKQIPIPLPPLHMQKRIVAEIEKQFSRLDEAVTNLKRVKANLKRYRASVLKAAVEGRLVETEAEIARREGREYESGKQLLERILETRRREWKGKGQYKEPAAPDVSELPELPEGWAWGTYSQAGSLQLGRQRAPKYHAGPNMRPYLRVQNVFEDRIDLSDVMEMDFPPNDFERYQLHSGDLLLNEGQSPELLGRPAIYRGELPGSCFTNTLIRFRAANGVSVDFALIVSRHFMHAGRFVDEGMITTNIAHLSVGRLATVEFPLPPLAEQQRIVAEVDRRLSLVRETEAQVEANLKRAERLRQSVLQKAFSGELVRDEAG